ncbi:MAG TPA: hypothetical protein VFA07_19335 [Chthonomonadaceae bacterium]|nr:hypothetical protein [Chthonomonadaceae bacterium]
MARLRGRGLGAGVALGTAAIVRIKGGIPMLPEVPPRIAERIAARRPMETPEVILVADDYRTALALFGSLPWGKVVGIVAGSADPDAPVPGVPAVVNVSYLLDAIEDDVLMLVDATQGVVLADPSGMAIAQYQAEHSSIAPRRRLYLDDAHLPARTIDGRDIQVLARVEMAEDIVQALDAGADALCVSLGTPLLPDTEETAQRRSLLSLLSLTTGKPVLLADDYALPPLALLEAAAQADIVLAEPPRDDLEGLGLEELASELWEAQGQCFEQDIACGMPRLAARLTSLAACGPPGRETERMESLAAHGATRLLLDLEAEILDASLLARIEALVAAASAHLLPVTAAVALLGFGVSEEDDPEGNIEAALGLIVGTGIAGIVVPPPLVEATKERIRGLHFFECREALLQFLVAGG